MSNPVNWFEIPAPNFEAAKEFYQNVFELEIQTMPMGPSIMGFFPRSEEGSGASGALVNGPGQVPNMEGLSIYFDCGEDLSPTLARALANGAQEVMPKTSIGEFGFIASFRDPEGNRISLHSAG